eukprot:g6347.t1
MNPRGHFTSILVALLGPFQFGLGLTIMNTMLDSLSSELDFDKNISGAVATSAIYLGCSIGSFFSGVTSHIFGDCAQLFMAIMFLLGNVLCTLSVQSHICWGGPLSDCIPSMLLIGRLLTGAASGVAVVISPKNLADFALPNHRMSLCTVIEIFIVAGALLGLIIGLPYEFDSLDTEVSWWRVMFLCGCIPASTQILLQFISFRYRVQTELTPNQTESTQVDDSFLHNADQSAPHQVPLTIESNLTVVGQELGHEEGVPLRMIFSRRYRRSLILGLGVPLVCQLSGSIVIDSYSTTIFKDAGFSRPIIGSILFGLTNLICTIITAIFIGQFKRRSSAFFSFIGMGVCFFGVALADLSHKGVRGILSVGFVLVYVAFYSAGCGPLSTAYAPEVVPTSIAGTVLGLGQSLSRFTNLILVLFFPMVLDNCGAFLTFLVLTAFTVGSYFFLLVFMVETNGRELVDIFRELEQ